MGFRVLAIAGRVMLVVLSSVAVSCGGDSAGPEPIDKAGPGFMVGNWIASVLVVTSTANPEVSVDLITEGATFTLSVEPSGRYTAILSGFGQASSESGTLSVEGPEVVFRRTLPSPDVARSTWVRNGADVTLTGPTQFDINLDGMTEDATIVIGLTPR